MGFSAEALSRIYHRTGGYCHLCGCKVSFTNYGTVGARGAWEVEHSIPWSLGGTDHLNNLYAACIPCNRAKGNGSTRTARAWNGRSSAPLSREQRKAIRTQNLWGGAATGFLFGMRFGPGGAILCSFLGALLGDSIKVK
ncbi:MAG TPA: HNH endonuclease [Terriglobia bacterium]|nr:HNH endonuclease [Terriglobia bacterium]